MLQHKKWKKVKNEYNNEIIWKSDWKRRLSWKVSRKNSSWNWKEKNYFG